MTKDNRPQNSLLAILFVGVLMGALDIAIVGPALPAIQHHFGVGERSLAWIFSIYVLFHLVGTPLMAKLSDIFGRRAIYVLDVLLFAAGSVMVAFAPAFWMLVAGRAVQGFGSGGIFPVASAVIGDTFPAEKRGGALGLIGAVFGVAFVIGPLLGGVLLLVGWQWLFLINLPIAAIVVLGALHQLPATRPSTRQPIDWPGMVTLTVMLGAMAFGISQLDTANLVGSFFSLSVLPFLLLAALMLPIFWRAEHRAIDPVLRSGLYGSRQMILVAAMAVGAGLTEASTAFVPQLVVAAFGVSTSNASFMLIPLVSAVAVGSPIVGKLLDRLGSRTVLLGGSTTLTLGLACLGLLGSTDITFFFLAMILMGLGIAALVGAPLRYIVLAEAEPSERATAQGSINIFLGIGQLLGGAFIGAIAGSVGGGAAGYAAAYTAGAAIAALLVLASLGLKNRQTEQAAVQAQAT
jgi:MFS family permease